MQVTVPFLCWQLESSEWGQTLHLHFQYWSPRIFYLFPSFFFHVNILIFLFFLFKNSCCEILQRYRKNTEHNIIEMHLHTIRISEMLSLHHIDYTYVSVLLGTLFIGFASCKQYLLLLCFCFFNVFIQSDVFCILMWVYSICIWFFYWCLWTHSYSLILCFVYSAFLWFPPHPTSPIFLTAKGLIKFALFLFFPLLVGKYIYIYTERERSEKGGPIYFSFYNCRWNFNTS